MWMYFNDSKKKNVIQNDVGLSLFLWSCVKWQYFGTQGQFKDVLQTKKTVVKCTSIIQIKVIMNFCNKIL